MLLRPIHNEKPPPKEATSTTPLLDFPCRNEYVTAEGWTHMAHDGDLGVRTVQLHGLAPFPTWNGTLAAASGHVTLLCENGDVAVLCVGEDAVRVDRLLPAPTDHGFPRSLCQSWRADARVFATAHDQLATFYDAADGAFSRRNTLRVRYAATSISLTQTADSCLLMVGTAFGVHLYKLQDANADQSETSQPIASAYPGVDICSVQFSDDGRFAAMAATDGRLFIRKMASEAFGAQVLSKVLASPRITALAFARHGNALLVATRKGNVYVFSRSARAPWRLHAACQDLAANPKPSASLLSGPAGTGMAATLGCWWGQRSEPGDTPSGVFVIGSRTANARLEMYDAVSGRLLHSLQLMQEERDRSSDDAQILGLCCLSLPSGGTARLVIHDASGRLVLVSWPFLDVMYA